MKALALLVVPACFALAAPAAADQVADAFYARCMSENSYQLPPVDLDEACACMAPVLVSFLTPEARQQIEQAIRANTTVAMSGNPYKSDPTTVAQAAIKQCPKVAGAMYDQKCSGQNAEAPYCVEMKKMLDGGP